MFHDVRSRCEMSAVCVPDVYGSPVLHNTKMLLCVSGGDSIVRSTGTSLLVSAGSKQVLTAWLLRWATPPDRLSGRPVVL